LKSTNRSIGVMEREWPTRSVTFDRSLRGGRPDMFYGVR